MFSSREVRCGEYGSGGNYGMVAHQLRSVGRVDPGDGVDAVQGDLKALLINILDAYEKNGEQELATRKLGQFLSAQYGSVGEAKNRLGDLPVIKAAFRKMQAELYSA